MRVRQGRCGNEGVNEGYGGENTEWRKRQAGCRREGVTWKRRQGRGCQEGAIGAASEELRQGPRHP